MVRRSAGGGIAANVPPSSQRLMAMTVQIAVVTISRVEVAVAHKHAQRDESDREHGQPEGTAGGLGHRHETRVVVG